jgi:hypothetical protein
MINRVVVPSDSPNGAEMAKAIADCRLIFFAGLPAAGKSLFVQQQTLLAAEAGKRIHFLRWDAALAAFETDRVLHQYPETDNVTHPVIRKAAGLWARRAVARWQAEFPGPEEVLIGELPIIGNRFVELVQIHDDGAEPLLAGELTRFLVPVPTSAVRRQLESKRLGSIANPRHADEARDAPMHILRHVWDETRTKAAELGLAEDVADGNDYDPTIYSRLYEHLLQHRNCRILTVETLYPNVGSAHDLDVATHELIASPGDVADVLAAVESGWDAEEVVRSVDAWYQV